MLGAAGRDARGVEREPTRFQVGPDHEWEVQTPGVVGAFAVPAACRAKCHVTCAEKINTVNSGAESAA